MVNNCHALAMDCIAHLADSQKPETTLCGLPWEDWQAPMPSDNE